MNQPETNNKSTYSHNNSLKHLVDDGGGGGGGER